MTKSELIDAIAARGDLTKARAELVEEHEAALVGGPPKRFVWQQDGQIGERLEKRRDEIASELAVARQEEVESRLQLRTAEERARALSGKAEGLRRAARAEREARERFAAARIARTRGAEVAAAVVSGGETALERIEISLLRALHERDQIQAQRTERAAEDGDERVVHGGHARQVADGQPGQHNVGAALRTLGQLVVDDVPLSVHYALVLGRV